MKRIVTSSTGLSLPDVSLLPLLLNSSCLSGILSRSSLLWLIGPIFSLVPLNFSMGSVEFSPFHPLGGGWGQLPGRKAREWLMGGEQWSAPHLSSPPSPTTHSWKAGFPREATHRSPGCSHLFSEGGSPCRADAARWSCSGLVDLPTP